MVYVWNININQFPEKSISHYKIVLKRQEPCYMPNNSASTPSFNEYIDIATSVIFTIRLLFPIRVAYLEVSDRYSTSLRSEYEKKFLASDLSEEKAKEAKHKIDNYLKASYIAELSEAQGINQRVFVSKSSFYYRALVYGLAANIPYVICIGFHLSRKDDKVQKVHLVYQKKIVNCILSNNFYA